MKQTAFSSLARLRYPVLMTTTATERTLFTVCPLRSTMSMLKLDFLSIPNEEKQSESMF